jgi:hypothetical protein
MATPLVSVLAIPSKVRVYLELHYGPNGDKRASVEIPGDTAVGPNESGAEAHRAGASASGGPKFPSFMNMVTRSRGTRWTLELRVYVPRFHGNC